MLHNWVRLAGKFPLYQCQHCRRVLENRGDQPDDVWLAAAGTCSGPSAELSPAVAPPAPSAAEMAAAALQVLTTTAMDIRQGADTTTLRTPEAVQQILEQHCLACKNRWQWTCGLLGHDKEGLNAFATILLWKSLGCPAAVWPPG